MEEVIKTIDGVADAVVVGIPDERFGEEIVAVVGAGPGDRRPTRSTAETVIEHVKAQLAGYKAPRRVRFVDHHRTVTGRQGRLRPPPGRDGRVGRGAVWS